ncbi:MAG: UbiA family prenyltransferase, partial [Planctomycetota bacterium]
MKARALLVLLRPFTLLAPVVGTLAAAAVAAAALGHVWWGEALVLAALSAVAATGASNAWNQVFDVELDRTNKPHRPLPSGAIGTGTALALGDILALAALALAVLVTPVFLACVAVGLFATWIYSAPPLRTKRSTFGALVTIAVPRGLLVPVGGWSVVAVPDSPDPWALGLVAGLFVLGAAATKDFADVEGDRAHGCRTLPERWGARRAARAVAPFLVLPFLLYPVFGALGWLHVGTGRLAVLAAVLVLVGGATARVLVRDPEGLGAGRGGHRAWVGMYLTLLA